MNEKLNGETLTRDPNMTKKFSFKPSHMLINKTGDKTSRVSMCVNARATLFKTT